MKDEPFHLQSGHAGEALHDMERTNDVRRRDGSSTWLLEYTVEGQGVGWIGDLEYRMKPGSFLMYEAGAPQLYSVDPRVGFWRHIWICFDPRPHWKEWINTPAIAPGVFVQQVQRDAQRAQVCEALREAVAYARSVRPHRRSLVLNVMERALLYCDEWNPAGNAASRDERIQAVLEHINEHAFEKLTIEFLAGVCGLSPSRFAHLFQEQMGQSPMQYIEERRLERAQELLRITSRPIAQIAEECGFSNPFYFSRIFKARTGVSPRDARTRYREGEQADLTPL